MSLALLLCQPGPAYRLEVSTTLVTLHIWARCMENTTTSPCLHSPSHPDCHRRRADSSLCMESQYARLDRIPSVLDGALRSESHCCRFSRSASWDRKARIRTKLNAFGDPLFSSVISICSSLACPSCLSHLLSAPPSQDDPTMPEAGESHWSKLGTHIFALSEMSVPSAPKILDVLCHSGRLDVSAQAIDV